MATKINQKVYGELKKLANKQTTMPYAQFASLCDFPYSTVDERNEFHHILGQISKHEVENERPMLSVLIHHLGDVQRTPGKGFFQLVDELNQRKEGESDLELQYRIIKECWRYWK